MKSIRNIALTALLTMGAFGAVTFTACNKDDEGCPTGYEGKDCKTLSVTKFIDTWTATDTEVGEDALPVYTAIITTGTSITEIRIGNFSDDYFINDVIATVHGNSFTIAPQDPDGDDYSVEGSGTYNTADETITIDYTITSDEGETRSYHGTWE